jgi:aspartate aminotransferase
VTGLSPTAAVTTGSGTVVLSTGDVRVPVHPEAAAAAPRRSDQPYRPPAGLDGLRAAVAARAGGAVSAEHVVVTPGARLAVAALFAAVLDGGEVLLPVPHWASYPPLIRMYGGVPVPVAGEPTAAVLDRHRTPATRLVVVNSPRNPDGAVIPPAALREVVDWAGRYGIVVLADEVYRAVPTGAGPPPSLLDLHPELPAHCVVVDGLSKSHALAGLRIGWSVAAPPLTAQLTAAASHLVGGTCTSTKETAMDALAGTAATAARLGPVLAGNLDRARAGLAGLPGVRCPRPAGGIFLFPDLRGWLVEAPAAARTDLAGWLRDEHGVAVVDGAPFGAPGHVRICFATPPDQLAAGIDRLAGALARG